MVTKWEQMGVLLIFVILVVCHIAVPKQCPLDEDSHSAPAKQND